MAMMFIWACALISKMVSPFCHTKEVDGGKKKRYNFFMLTDQSEK
jgi:hypothetical protein